MSKKTLLKVASWVGVIACAIAVFFTENPSQYIPETLAFIYALLYGYNIVKGKMVLMVATFIFVLTYLFVNFSIMDLIIWVIIAWCLSGKEERHFYDEIE